MSGTLVVKRALLSVADKSGLDELAQQLAAQGVELLSTGGTAAGLRALGLTVIDVSEYTGHPEIMQGRVKTLHPRVHGGLLGRRGTDEAVMAQHGIAPIDLVVCNLYPFEATIAQDDCTLADAIENIDIGGPSMVRSAAKNHADVAVVVDPGDYPRLIDELKHQGGVSYALRAMLAKRAFALTAHYDSQIAAYLTSALDSRDNVSDENDIDNAESADAMPDSLILSLSKTSSMRYGENPHQQAALYTHRGLLNDPDSVVHSDVLQGKALSYNNVADADAAWACVCAFDSPACVIVKHANPCGVACAATLSEAYASAYRTDPVSAFGGIIAFNRTLDETTARAIIEQQFVEVILAPEVNDAAREVIASRPNVRLLKTSGNATASALNIKSVDGGVLIQSRDAGVRTASDLKCVTKRQPDATQTTDLLFAWRVVKFVKSNAIVYARDKATIGVGAGQMSRVYSARIAAIKAADESLQVTGSVMASDAFFPFRDGIDQAHEAGIVAVIQPGGSKRDDEVIAAADEHNMTMVFTGMRHFRH